MSSWWWDSLPLYWCTLRRRWETRALYSMWEHGQNQRQPSASLRAGSHHGPNMPVPVSWASQPSELWKINVCHLKKQSLWYFVIAAQVDLTHLRRWLLCKIQSLWGLSCKIPQILFSYWYFFIKIFFIVFCLQSF